MSRECRRVLWKDCLASRRFWVVTDPVSDLVEETPEDNRETRIVVLFGSAGPVLLEELDEKYSE